MTAWIPLGDIKAEKGTLVICPKTHNNPKFKILRETYGHLDVDRDVPSDPNASGHLTNNPLTWQAKANHKITWNSKAIQKQITA